MTPDDRKALEARVLWNNGGYGFGICAVAGAMLWNDQRPKDGEQDWPSIVALCGERSKYTDDELVKLVEFADFATKRYDALFRVRMGANLILFDKNVYDDGRVSWMRKRMSWDSGPMYSPTLDEALATMRRN
jgi:hypothetical protein